MNILTKSFVHITYVNILSCLIILIPLTLLTGPFLPDLVISIVGISFLYIAIKQKLWKYFNNIFFYIFILFYIYILVRSIFSSMPIESLQSSLFYFRFGIFAIAVWYIIDMNPKFIRSFSIFLLIIFIVSLIDGYYQYFIDQYYNIFNFKSAGIRMSLLLDHKLFLGGYLSRLFPLLLATLIYSFKMNHKYLIITGLLLILIDILIYLSGERTAFLTLLISTLYIVILISKYKFIRLITFCLSIIIILSLTVFDSKVMERNITKTYNQMKLYEDDKSEIVIFSEQHNSHYLTSISIFKDNPIFGVGSNLYRYFCDQKDYKIDSNSCATHPHNSYIQLLAETGLIGFLFLLSSFLALIYFSFNHIISIFGKYKKTVFSDYQICLLSCLLITLWPIAPTLDFFNNYINVIYYLPIGFLLNSLYAARSVK